MVKFSDLIEDIYDAALAPARWNDVVVGINEFVGGQATGIFSKDVISKSGLTHYFCGADPHYIRLYAETYSKLGPLTFYPPVGKIVSMPDLVPYDEFCRGRFYQEWMRPQGCVDMADAVLENSKSDAKVLLAVHVRKRMVDDEMRRRIARLVPHAHRALMINRAIDRKNSETATFADTLDAIGAGIGLTPAELRVLLAIVEVGGVPESAVKLSVAETTVKTHLKQVFSKTGASRQADLIKLAAGFSFPLAKN